MKVFISSTYKDLVDHRAKVAEAVERLGQQGVRMEVFGARPHAAMEACRDEIEEADVFVGIYAHRYGYVSSDTGISITELEFRHAWELDKPMLCFTVDEDYPWPPKQIETGNGREKLDAFKREVCDTVVRDSFTTPEDLAFKVAASLGRLLLRQKIKAELVEAVRAGPALTEQALDQVTRRAERLSPLIRGARVLLVNDVPTEMGHVTQILRNLGVDVDIATRSEAALEMLRTQSFDAVISDMARHGVQDAGLRFLEAMRQSGLERPLVFTVGRLQPERGTPPYAFGITNRVDDLLNLLFDVFERERG